MKKIYFFYFLLFTATNLSFTQAQEQRTRDSLISITGVGDMMLGSHFPRKEYLPFSPYKLLESIKDSLGPADIIFANLEGCFLNKGKVAKRCSDTTKCYAFKMPESYAQVFKWSGINLLSIANNHIYDFGIKGVKTTCSLLDSAKIKYAGTIRSPKVIFETKEKKIGFAAFAPNNGTLSINNYSIAKKIIQELDSLCDIVIVSFHGGAEGSKHQHVTKEKEIFYGENRGNVYEFAHKMIDYGADVIFGHGPHVTRAVEIYKERFIIYSLGNFCTYGRFNIRGANGIAPIVKIQIDRKGRFIKGNIIPIYQSMQGTKYDPQRRVISKINQLIRSDFPNNKLTIGENGKILYIR